MFNIKKLLGKAPGGKRRIASYAAALYLIKEDFGVSERKIKQGLNEYGVDFNDFLAENTQWFMLEDRELSPGTYRLSENKVLLKAKFSNNLDIRRLKNSPLILH